MERQNLLGTKARTIFAVLIIYLICFSFRVLEYFVIRTDQTFFGEAFIHKLIGIAVLVGAAFLFQYKFSELGIKTGKAFLDILKGIAFGLGVFVLSYGVEILILAASKEFQGLEFYVSAYSVNGNQGKRTEFIFFFFCIVGNIINVMMEEGVFRGLFQKMLGDKCKFVVAAIIASALFGVWHIMSPLRGYIDGEVSLGGFIANSCLLIGTSALVGFKFALIGKMTGNLYMAMGDHFVNNTIVNILHVISTEEADHLMTV
ncbi:MAG: CPBP family intramembrane metalloprotease, partial [Bacilli bacterium]|nr:CPBP family intramembrane metalloprotease [Bacilli bacterium]